MRSGMAASSPAFEGITACRGGAGQHVRFGLAINSPRDFSEVITITSNGMNTMATKKR